jgi:eukaryotic-like serine/threonine-protein kinase
VVVYAPPPLPRDARGARLAPNATAEGRRGARGSRLVWRIFLAAGAGLALLVVAVIGTVAVFARQSTDEALERGLADAGRYVASVLEGRRQALAAGTAVFAQDPKFVALVADSARLDVDVRDRATEAAERLGATWVQIVDADGLRLAKSDDPTAPVVSLGETALVGGALAGEHTNGAGVAGDTAVFEGVAVPVVAGATGGQIVGVLMAARTLDSTVARELQAATHSEVLIYLRDERNQPRVAASTLSEENRRTVLDAMRAPRDGTTPGLRVRLDGDDYVGQETVLRAATTGTPVGGVLTLRSRDRELAPYVSLQRRIALAGAGGLVLAFVGAFGVARQITGQIRALRDATRRAAAGQLGRVDLPIESAGEVAELADAVRSVLDQVHERHELAALVERARALPAGDHTDPAEAATLPPTLAPGSVLANRYRIDAVLGVGGNGIVYRATDTELSEIVAVKTLRPEALAGGAEALARLKEEIRLARRITHTGVVRIHDFGEANGTYFITMEHLSGLSLAQVLKRVERLPVGALLALGKQLCSALGAAHAQGIIHRDVKPQNLVVQPDGALKVLDFGVARLAARTSGLTATGLLVGTPAYMAPEQLLDEPVDVRADVYAVGVVLYEAATGRPPHQGSTPASLIARVLSEEPTPPSVVEPSIAPGVSDAIMRALARDRDQRPASAAALHDLLDAAARAPQG